jgi:predicted regulator of Ras-like GTPase activity (Roadblock/LC7/MglB family)
MSVWCLKVASKDVRYVASLVKEAVMAEGSRTERLMRRLQELQMNTPDVEATSMVSVDGLTMASILPSGVEEDRVAAMSAAMLSLGERIASELGRGMLDEVYVKGERGYVVLRAVGEEAVLTVLARQQTKLGLLFLDMRRASEELATILEA